LSQRAPVPAIPMNAPLTDPAADAVADEVPAPASPVGITGLVADIRQLASDAKVLAEAELAYQTTRAKLAGAAARNVAILGVGAFVLAFFALGALTVGLLLALTPLVTAWGATAIVVGVLLIAAFACLLTITRKVAHLRQVLSGDPAEPKP